MDHANNPHILVIDDDEALRRLLESFLKKHGFTISAAASAAEARKIMQRFAFDLMIVDVMMPEESGLDFVKSLPARHQTPILMLTAKTESDDRIEGLKAGVDDYLGKPFEPMELVLRIQAILRRSQADNNRNNAQNHVRFGDFIYDLNRQELRHKDAVVHLTTAENSLLHLLCQNPHEIFSRSALMEQTGLSGEPRTVDVQMTRLRKKIEEDPRYPLYLQTIRNKGYILKTDS